MALTGASVISPTVCVDPQGQGMASVWSNHRPWWWGLAMGLRRAAILRDPGVPSANATLDSFLLLRSWLRGDNLPY